MRLSYPRVAFALAISMAAVWTIAAGENRTASIHFTYQPIGFRLDSCETPRRHAPETMAGGVAIFDYNNDGYLDIFFTNGADIDSLKKTSTKYSDRLFENDGKGHFTDVTAKAGLAGTGFDNAVAIGDYDNDGREDIFVGGVHGNHLYHNDGGVFTDVTVKAGLAAWHDPQYGPLWTVGAAWVDVNNDGLLDLFVVNYLAWDPKTEPACEAAPGQLDYCHPKFYKPTPNQLFLNNGDGTFRDISAESGIRSYPGKGMGVGVADYDLDGLMDLFVTNDKMDNFFFHNKGGGRFEEIAFDAGVALDEDGKFISGMGVDFRDIDNDGLPDLVFAALEGETFPLFRNLGKRGFADITRSSGLARATLPMAGYSPTVADFDNDGWKDIFVTRGHVQALGMSGIRIDQPNTAFRNLGGAKFQALTEESGLSAQPPARHRGSAVGDLNGDGRLDVVTAALSAPAEVWLNDSPGDAHWLELKLEGTASNRDGIGAAIRLTAGGAVQYSQVSFAAGYASSSAAPTHFGLGPAASASLIEIRWPSGMRQQLRNVSVDRLIRVKEPPAK
ncbi:MAG TPA: CRTAC1 family protein [Bryobacteraceae bacterium]|nr:CRTAC1 family protein [Bryobacteraceae bacterium]